MHFDRYDQRIVLIVEDNTLGIYPNSVYRPLVYDVIGYIVLVIK